MKKIVIMLFIILLSSSTFSFEFMGIKSGMTRDEIDNLGVVDDIEVRFIHRQVLKNYELSSFIELSYTGKSSKLYKLRVFFPKPDAPDASLGLKSALNKSFNKIEIKEDSYKDKYWEEGWLRSSARDIMTNCFYVEFVDLDLIKQEAQIWEKEYMSKLKQH